MSTQKNQPFRPTAGEIDTVTKKSKREALKGSILGGIGGALIGRKYRSKLIGAAIGATAGNLAGRMIGRRTGARDVVQSRKALLQGNQLAELLVQVNELKASADQRDFDKLGNDYPDAFPQTSRPQRRSVRGAVSEPGIGASSEALFAEEREALAEIFGWGVVESLSDDELTFEHAEQLRNAILAERSRVNEPGAGLRSGEDFERAALQTQLGAAAVASMGSAEVHCNFLSAQRRGLIEFNDRRDTQELALINRERSAAGTFEPNSASDPGSVARAYSAQRKTGRTTEAIGALGAAAGVAGAIAHLRGRKGRRPRLPLGVPKLDNAVDVESTVLSGRLPLMTFAVGHPGSFRIARATLRGKKQPGVVKLKGVKRPSKPAQFGFLIHDPDFDIDPVQSRPSNAATRKRPVTRTRAELLKWLRGMTALQRCDFGAGSVVAEGIVDALGIGSATNPRKKKLVLDRDGNPVNPAFLADPGTKSTSSFASALVRLTEFGFASPALAGISRDIAVIGGADLGAERLNAAMERARKRKERQARQVRGGVEAVSPAGPTALSAIQSTLNEFDANGARDRARRRAGELGAAGVGGVGGALAGAFHDQGTPVRVRNLNPGDSVYRRKGPFGVYQHSGVVDETGKRIVHRTKGSSVARSVTPETFVRGGRGPLRRESHGNDLPRAKAARNATAAAGTRQGTYSILGENCQHASSRIASKAAPASRQLRKVVAGAIAGAAVGSTIDRIRGHRKDTRGNR